MRTELECKNTYEVTGLENSAQLEREKDRLKRKLGTPVVMLIQRGAFGEYVTGELIVPCVFDQNKVCLARTLLDHGCYDAAAALVDTCLRKGTEAVAQSKKIVL